MNASDSLDHNINFTLAYLSFCLFSFVISFLKLPILFLPLFLLPDASNTGPYVFVESQGVEATITVALPLQLLCLMAFYSYVKVNKAHVGIQATKHKVINRPERICLSVLF